MRKTASFTMCFVGGRAGQRLKVRSMVGLLPFCAVTVFEKKIAAKYPELGQIALEYLKARPELMAFIHDPLKPGCKGRLLGSVLNEANLRRVLKILLDEQEFLSPFGIRAVSRIHQEHPYTYRVGDREYRVSYLPGESDNDMFGGNSNWRGPIWMPVNMLILRALLQYYMYYGNSFTVECPTGSGKHMNLYEVAEEIGRRLFNIFLKNEQGNCPCTGIHEYFKKILIGEIIPFSMSTSTGILARGSAQATRRDGPGRSRVSCICLRLPMRKMSSSRRKKKWQAEPFSQGGRIDLIPSNRSEVC